MVVMSVTIKVNGHSNCLVHKGSGGFAKCTVPDVCKTPSPGGPVPVPYPVIVSMSSDLVNGTMTVKVDGGNMAAVKGSEFSRCTGDEPGTAGGVKSSTNMKEATWILYSFDVKLEGKNACRLGDKMQMNHGNTVCLAGEVDTPVSGDGDDDRPSKEDCNKAIKLLEQPDRLSQKLKLKIPEKRKQEWAAKIANGTITSNDLPGKIQNDFPPRFKGKTLEQVRAECGKGR
jgi:hypothetical protein